MIYLVDCQVELADQIYGVLIKSEYGTNINLYGKTEYLQEDWKVFYLCGIN